MGFQTYGRALGRWALILVSAATLGMAATGAQASKIVFGSTAGQACYEEAQFGTGTGAIKKCDEALREDGLTKRDEAATLVNRGILYNRAKNYPRAMDDFNAALVMDPELGPAYLNRGNSFFFMQDLDAAMEDYNRAIELETRDLYSAYFNRGLVHYKRGDRDAARADFQQALALRPDFVGAQGMLAELDRLDGEAAQATTADASEG